MIRSLVRFGQRAFFLAGIFLLRLSGKTHHYCYSGSAMTRLLARFWQRASFCVGKGHFGLSSAAELLVWKGSNARSTCFCTKTTTAASRAPMYTVHGLYAGAALLERVPTGIYVTRARTASMFFPFLSDQHWSMPKLRLVYPPQLNLATQALRPHASEATTDTPSDASRQSLAPEGAVPHYRV